LRTDSFIIPIMRGIVFIICLFVALSVYAQDVVTRVDIEGNNIVSDATIISKIKVRAGQPYNENIINTDVKNLYATGFFETVEAQRRGEPDEVVVVFVVKEKSILKKITIQGARFIRPKAILEAIDIKEGAFVDDYKMKEAVRQIKDLYNGKGFSQAEISYELIPLEKKNEREAKIEINEKGVLKVRGVKVVGNKSISTSRILRAMKTRKAWLFNKGLFKREVLRDDIKRITDYYKLQGFSDAKVDIETEQKAKGIYLTVVVDEGRRYYVGTITVEGNEQVGLEDIRKAMALKEGSIFSEQAVYADSSSIREVYVDRGYIFSQVEPFSLFNPQTEKIDVSYRISENDLAYIEDIEIKGNTKTKDKVIRRELRVYPGEKFDGRKVRKSKERLNRLGFFDEIRLSTEPGSETNYVDLIVDVKEAKTGYVSFGGGYSSIEEFVGFVEIRQRNFDYKNFSTFTGDGQDLSLMVSMGTLSDRYQLSFTNPWIFDTPLSFGFDAYQKGHKKEDNVGYAYEQKVTGGALRLGREFGDYIEAGLAYRFESVEISDVDTSASQALKDEEGTADLSSGIVSASYDKRDNALSPRKGFYFRNTFQTTGGPFGGDRDFTKYFGRLSIYVPAINRSVLELRLRTGFADPFGDTNKIPLYERFFAGGASTIRGYQERKVGPIDSGTEDPVGGEAMFVGNVEYTYPLVDFLKVAAFYDTGNVWEKNSDFMSGDLFSSIGLGVRVKTPIGPVSVDYGWPLDLEPGEEKKTGRFHFNMSREF